MSIISEELVYLDVVAESKDEALKMIAKYAFENDRVTDEVAYYESLKAREEQSSTGFSDGIAIPHGKSSSVKEASVVLVRFSEGVDWDSMDGKPTTLAIGLAIPEDGANLHLKILSSIARNLMNEDFRNSLMDSKSKGDVIKALESAIN
jgi:PTS system mannose-specific IIC component